MESISPRQKRVLDFIIEFNRTKGYSPSVRDVANGCNIGSSSLAQYHLNVLERQGYIHRDPEVSRSIALAKNRLQAYSVPLLGTIAAGQPIPVPTENTWHAVPEEMIEVPAGMMPGNIQAFALRVQGRSMVDALVDDGDIVVLEAIQVAEDGQMVAAWLIEEERATLKKLYREPSRIRLQPANPSMEPIYVNPDNLQVQGRVIAVLRKYDSELR